MNTCRCGCGNPVAAGKQWIRGHNMRAAAAPGPSRNDPDTDAAYGPGYEPPPGFGTFTIAGPPQEWWEQEAAGFDDGPLTYDQAAAGIADDPEPARLPPGGSPGDPPPVTRAVLRDVSGKSLFWLLMGIELWGIADPYCAQVAADAAPKIAVKAAPVLCGSPQIVQFFTRATTFMKWTELGMACKPVVVAVIAHHVTRSVTVTRTAAGPVAQEADWSRYSAA